MTKIFLHISGKSREKDDFVIYVGLIKGRK